MQSTKTLMRKLCTLSLLTATTGSILAPGLALGGPTGAMLSLALAAAAFFASYWFCDLWVLSLFRARPAPPGEAAVLREVVAELAARAGIPLPRIYVIESRTPNAFATGRNPARAAVAATTGLLQILDREELAGVMAHELAHIKHRDGFSAFFEALFSSALSLLSQMTHRLMLMVAGQRPTGRSVRSMCRGLVAMRLAPVAASLTDMAVCRSREYAADAEGAMICGDPLSMARALRKLESHSRSLVPPFDTGWRRSPKLQAEKCLEPLRRTARHSSHPPLEQRIRRLEAAAFGIRW